jgi:hypothetical protein
MPLWRSVGISPIKGWGLFTVCFRKFLPCMQQKFYFKRVISAIFVILQSKKRGSQSTVVQVNVLAKTRNPIQLNTREIITCPQSCHRGMASVKWWNLVQKSGRAEMSTHYPAVWTEHYSLSLSLSLSFVFTATHKITVFRPPVERWIYPLPKPGTSIYLRVYSPLLDFGGFSIPWSFTQSIGILGRGISPSQCRYLHTQDGTNTE